MQVGSDVNLKKLFALFFICCAEGAQEVNMGVEVFGFRIGWLIGLVCVGDTFA